MSLSSTEKTDVLLSLGTAQLPAEEVQGPLQVSCPMLGAVRNVVADEQQLLLHWLLLSRVRVQTARHCLLVWASTAAADKVETVVWQPVKARNQWHCQVAWLQVSLQPSAVAGSSFRGHDCGG